MTAEEWKACEEKLSGHYGIAHLKVDEYNLTLSVVPVAHLR